MGAGFLIGPLNKPIMRMCRLMGGVFYIERKKEMSSQKPALTEPSMAQAAPPNISSDHIKL